MSEELKQEPFKNTARRDRLQQIEQDIQSKWQSEGVFEANPDLNKPKFFLTFPYPYANGRLHLGHGYSYTKCDFTARFKNLLGFNVLMPFGFHVTGMPICAAAQKLKRELQTNTHNPVHEKSDTSKTQYQTLQLMGIADEEIPKFVDPYYWVHYFPPYGKSDLIRFGAPIDWRRSFITSDANPYYDSFIRWQFQKLKEGGYVKFGKRPSIFSILDNQMCADHDRREGEGVGPQEYSLIKIRVIEPQLLDDSLNGRKVYLVAATLRPETMYGQTNCYVLPDGLYGTYEMKDDDIFICSQRSALNMAYQQLTKIEYKAQSILNIEGSKLIGLKLKAPLTQYEYVYALPMDSIKMDKGTGIVTSVPSDAPDDYATLRDLQKKPDYYKVQKQWTQFEPIRIIDIPSYSDMPALKACDEFKVKSSKDAENLKKAKDKVYLLGFYEGVMLVGQYKGLKVQDAKILVKRDLIQSGECVNYYEPENLVLSRSGDECVVSLCDQWYLSYNDPQWKNLVRDHVKNSFSAYNDDVHKAVLDTVDWLREWGCSRSFGLGTKLPWDPQYLIESLSDSTIYFAYYTIVHYLQSNFDGSKPGILDINHKDLTLQTWDYIFNDASYDQQNIIIPQDKLDIMKNEFKYWYPLDLRCSGKDLIKNHLTMSLFNHAAIWKDQQKNWPKSFFCNGYILVDGVKMSKSLGNFHTINDLINLIGADATRFGCAQAGDTLDDANFEFKGCDQNILKISTLLMYLEKVNQQFTTYRKDTKDSNVAFFDEVFLNQINQFANLAIKGYHEMKFRDVMKYGFFNLQGAKDEYLLLVNQEGPRQDIILKYIEVQLSIMYPIIPHMTDYAYQNYFIKTLDTTTRANYPINLNNYRLPDYNDKQINYNILREFKYYNDLLRLIRISFDKFKTPKKGKGQQAPQDIKIITLIIAKDFADWQKEVLVLLNKGKIDEKGQIDYNWQEIIKSNPQKRQTSFIQKQLQFGNFALSEYRTRGKEAIDPNVTINEFDLIARFKDNILKEFKVQSIEFIDHLKAYDNENKNIQAAAQLCQPLKPVPIFD